MRGLTSVLSLGLGGDRESDNDARDDGIDHEESDNATKTKKMKQTKRFINP
jgi:hypothetical protein